MFLLLFRAAALALLIDVAMATQPAITCRQEVPAGLIRDLWSRTVKLTVGLPVRCTTRGRRSNRPAVAMVTRLGIVSGVPQGPGLRPETNTPQKNPEASVVANR